MPILIGPQATIESVGVHFLEATQRTRQIADVLDRRYPQRLASNASVQEGLLTYFGVGYPVEPADRNFVGLLQTVFAAMNSLLNSWATVYVEFLPPAEHDPREYAYVLPPVIFPNATGEQDDNNPNSEMARWSDVQANIATIRTEFVYGGHHYRPRTDLGFRINLNMSFREADPTLKVVTIIHELSHALANTIDEIGGVTFNADTVHDARAILADPRVGPARARTLADCWAWFAMDCDLD